MIRRQTRSDTLVTRDNELQRNNFFN